MCNKKLNSVSGFFTAHIYISTHKIRLQPMIFKWKEKQTKQFQKKLIHWYRQSGRKLPWRESGNPYHIWVSEVMLQQTQVATVTPYFQRFLKAFPTIEKLAAADQQQVLKLWEGLGYYARARNLQKAARVVVEKFGGKIPVNYDGFRALPGVGPYIAAAVQSIAFNQPYAVVDGNVKRVLARMFAVKSPVNDNKSLKIFQEIADATMDKTRPAVYNQAIMELGALICRPRNPLCAKCPVDSFCRAFQTQSVNEFPYRKKRVKIPERHFAIAVIRKGEQLLIIRRPEKGLLGGLWEFPGGELIAGESAERACLRVIKETTAIEIKSLYLLTHIQHIFTHFKLSADVFTCDDHSGKVKLAFGTDFRWVMLQKIDHFPFPNAHQKIIRALRAQKSRRI